ncbi:Hsp20/alpha crystallin family protein [Oceanobacillus sp. J11TS1]|uniref:Hsp20/alpha crystallin family protein n=1 Tax=Oceanobacillus sp. J11TS1 TaxID=2807191 RepID=UPI001B0C7CF0|nr:Hsp20/alpha crystallin family protein [Oceanobacillus sp. J11TS1]GIO22777.1 18 kDa heat shock protein [Oceanobacillus sp. J11TS1]
MAGLIPFNRKNRNVVSASPKNPFNMIDDFFDEAFNDFPILRRNLITDPFKVDVKEEDEKYFIEAELPGVKKEDVDINLNDDGRLSISVNREEKVEKKDDDSAYIHRERRRDSMQRSLYLTDANPDGRVHARMENGVLEVTVEKEEQEQINNGRKIEIE